MWCGVAALVVVLVTILLQEMVIVTFTLNESVKHSFLEILKTHSKDHKFLSFEEVTHLLFSINTAGVIIYTNLSNDGQVELVLVGIITEQLDKY